MARYAVHLGPAGPFLLQETSTRFNFVAGVLVKETVGPIVPQSWDLPRAPTFPIEARSWLSSSRLLLSEMPPGGSRARPNPAGPAFPIAAVSWQFGTPLAVLIPATPLAPLDLPNPRGPAFPAGGLSWTLSPSLALLIPDAPLTPLDWQNPRGPTLSRDGLSWALSPSLALLIPDTPLVPLDWPAPRGPIAPVDGLSWALPPPLALLLTPESLPVGAAPAWPNPDGPTFPLANRTWLATMSGLLYPDPEKPPLSFDWPNPRGPVYAIGLRTFAGAVPLVLFPTPTKPPVSYDWTNATRRTVFVPLENRGFTNAIPIYTQPAIVRIIGYPPAPLGYPNPIGPGQFAAGSWVRRVAEVTNLVQSGRINATLNLDLLPNTTSTSIIDSRVGPASVIMFMPLTSAAAMELAAGTMFVGAQTKGSATVTHSFDSTDRRFRALIIG